jgi:hypothetical protein
MHNAVYAEEVFILHVPYVCDTRVYDVQTAIEITNPQLSQRVNTQG